MKRRVCALLLVLSLFAALFCGCSAKQEDEVPSPTAGDTAPEPSAPESEPQEPVEAASSVIPEQNEDEIAEGGEALGNIVRTYNQAEPMPLTTEAVTLTAWDYCVPPVMAVIEDYGTDCTFYRELQNRTGIKLDFTTASMMTASTNIALMVAANELPDIIYNFAMFYTGSLDELVESDIIINFADYQDIMPNYFDIIKNNADIARDLSTSNGYYPLCSHLIQESYVQNGGVIRSDWLEANELEIPVTLEDYENVLLAFQSENDCANPFWLASNGGSELISSAFNINITGTNNSLAGWLYIDGEMRPSIFMEEFQEYISLINKWYDMSLISVDFFSHTYSASAGNEFVSNGQAGIWMTAVNGLTNLPTIEPDTKVTPIARAVMNEGDKIHFDDARTSRVYSGGCAVASTCPDIELACRLMDYGYCDDGIILQNYGIEGETFNYDENGEPVFCDMIVNNDEGMPFAVALIKYTSTTPASISIDSRNFVGYTDEQVLALEVWKATGEKFEAAGSVWDSDDQVEFTNLAADMASFCSTECLKFITGERPLSEWDSFISDIENLFDFDRMKELQENAIEAYLNKQVIF